jgi:hypothetical protein
MNRVAQCLSCVSLTFFVSVHSLNAANPATTTADLQQVQQLLGREAQPETAKIDRRQALNPSVRPETAANIAWWQAGFVKVANSWQLAESLSTSTQSATINQYLLERASASKSVESQMKLANWCRNAKLVDQERAHLSQVMLLAGPNFDRVSLYKRMGYRPVGSQWVSPSEYQEIQAQQRRQQVAFHEWKSAVERIIRNWSSNAKQQKLAQDELAGIHDKAAIPVLLAASSYGEPLALAICECLQNIDCFESSQALATISVQTDWKSVRERSVECLKQRRIDDFAPALLSEMSSPFVTKRTNSDAAAPRLILREEADRYFAIDVSVVELTYLVTTYIRQQKTTIDVLPQKRGGPETALGKTDRARILDDLDYVIQSQVEQQNDLAEEYNSRAAATLAAVTGQEPCADPRYWWSWWQLYTGTEQCPKRCQVTSRELHLPTYIRCVIMPSCLVAGTPICTDRGFVAVDQIQVGDRVLAKDISSGELAFKPVLHTTERRPVSVKKFLVGGSTITASEGHHFWVSGTGWSKTRELAAGQPIHTATGMSRIESAAIESEPAPVYNLVVADFHTYFVGQGMILSHDVIQPSPTNVKVPGLEVD